MDGTYAAAINQDGTLNSASNPLPSGAVVTIFATGLGPLSPTPSDGAIMQPPLAGDTLPVYINWLGPPNGFFDPIIGALPQYAGPAPFEVAGVSQINFTPSMVDGTITVQAGSVESLPFKLYLEQDTTNDASHRVLQ